MITKVDWNREGLAEGSSITEDAWKDWNKSAISRDNAKLFRKRTLKTIREFSEVVLKK